MKKIKFPRHNLLSVLAGERKTIIQFYKPGSRDFTRGNIVIGEFPEGLNVLLRILKTEKKQFSSSKDINDAIKSSGFEDNESALSFVKEQNPDFKPSETIAVITFEILRSGEEPVVKLNEYAPQ